MQELKDMAEEKLRAARALHRDGFYADSVSRSYYAAYCMVFYSLRRFKSSLDGRSNPTHADVPRLIKAYLNNLSRPKQDELIRLMWSLYHHRVDADYMPKVTIDATIAGNCIRDASRVLEILER